MCKTREMSILALIFSILFAFHAYGATDTVQYQNHSYNRTNGWHSVHVNYPQFSGFEAAASLNEKIENAVQQNIANEKLPRLVLTAIQMNLAVLN